MAEALQELYPGIKFGIGPAIENGFYYDVDPGEVVIKEADFAAIEKKMQELVAKKEEIKRQDISKADALKMFGERGEEYKVELISELEDGKITTYTQGAFTDLCRGPHLPNTSYIKAIKITSAAGAYWRGDENRKQLVRLYGITFPKKKMLDEYLTLMEEAKKRDHRKIGCCCCSCIRIFLCDSFIKNGWCRFAFVVASWYTVTFEIGRFLETYPKEIWLSAGDDSAYRWKAVICDIRPLC